MIFRLAWRSIWRNRRRTLITVLSIAFGLTFAIFFIAMGNGMYTKMISEAVRMQAGHLTLERAGYLEAPAIDLFLDRPGPLRARIDAMPRVERTKLMVLGQGIARSSAGTVGVAVMGVEPSSEVLTSPLAGRLISGRYLEDSDDRWVVVGQVLADRLKVTVGKKLVITTNNAAGDLVDELCRVRGIFKTGSEEVDGYLLQAPISFTRRLYGLPAGGATKLGVILKNPGDQDRTLIELRALVKGQKIEVQPWQKEMPELASYIKLDEGSNFVFQGILLFLILFTIFNTILMSVMERQREFAMLQALGTRPSQVAGQVFLETCLLGALGCLLGIAGGSAAALALQHWGLDLALFYEDGITISGFAVDPVLRAKLSAGILFWTSGMVFIITLLLSLIPLRHAARVNIVDELR